MSFMALSKRIRKNFGRITQMASMPNLIEVQKKSYDTFLQMGLRSVFKSIFPVEDLGAESTLEFIDYTFDSPKYYVEECRQRGITYASPLKVTFRLIVWEVDRDTGAREIKGIKEQDVYVGDIPLMTENGTFIINGTERVIVSQMHRSPGVFFDHDRGKTHSSGKYLYSARVIPYRGSWLDFEFDSKDLIYFRIDRRRKLYVTTLLRALGLTTQEILDVYYDTIIYKKAKNGWSVSFNHEKFRGIKLLKDLIDAKTGDIVVEAGIKVTPRLIKKLISDGLKEILVDDDDLIGQYIAVNLKDVHGEIYLNAGDELKAETIELLKKMGIKEIPVLAIDYNKVGPYIRNTLLADKNFTQEEALVDIYKVMRPGEPPSLEAAKLLFDNLFFNVEKYDMSVVGRVKLNAHLNLSIEEEIVVLTSEDIKCIIKKLVSLKDGDGEIDDIDHLGNRRVRSVGELIENQFRIGLIRMVRAIIERMGTVEIDTVMPYDLISPKLLMAVIREFFGTSQLSQFMDQTNPLSEITHKRRLSALGPGGLTRERASFEVRDVHPTHYGRICPIETPEGQNIGLINSLATFARVNKYGFVESPYRRVIHSTVIDEIVYLSAIEEGKYIIAQANAEIDSSGKLISNLISCRHNGDFVMSTPEEVDFIDVSPMQIVSVAASLIPFLENDDANRALMGSNMQRQAVPLLKAEAPLVGTGIEDVVARDSGATIVANHDGIVDQVDATRIVIRNINNTDGTSSGVDIYSLLKFQRTNHNTCINQRPLVRPGMKVKQGEVIADGPSTDRGELALGRNVLVAFMPWNGYNFEDSILISERIVSEDVFTSVHIEEFEIIARDTRLGPEEITRDIPNISDENLRHLDEVGIVHIGAEVQSGDILVGKVTPKSESPMTPEEKLLRAIFGEKAADIRDSSLYVPPGVSGTVVEVRVFTRRGIDKDQRSLAIERQEIKKLTKDRDDELYIIENFTYSRLKSLLLGQKLTKAPKGSKIGAEITEELLDNYSKGQWWQIVVDNVTIMEEIETTKAQLDKITEDLNKKFENKIEKLRGGDDLPQGALKVVKVFIAMKHKLQPGDKMAGRHGNKGVISRILPIEDMPYLEDGTPVDIVLNPLGVPSRMNVGQILETHLGWAAVNVGKKLGKLVDQFYAKETEISGIRDELSNIYKQEDIIQNFNQMNDSEILDFSKDLSKGVPVATPVFDGAKEADIVNMLKQSEVDESGQVRLIDGRTGEYFDRKVTVGYIYMLKLHHLVDDKIHARSIGPYSLVTQQPLGGKSHFGGQRFGEMECWALEAYGAAYTLQEMLTVKSDDVVGRIKIYESIVRSDQSFEPGIPESFNVMVKELRSLALNIKLEQTN
ncbi:DNA-directed RNA polymerase subunit beta [Rickettsiales bacterium Ac37b]|nr:DNA-directed RNA polymerase subunit beta [Rickettsiales bacterium Ac37b]